MNAIQAFGRLVRSASPRQVLLLAALMILVGLTDGVGILMLVPLLDLLGSGHSNQAWAMQLQHAAQSLGFSLSVGFVLVLFVLLTALRSGAQFAREQTGIRMQLGVVDQLRVRCFSALLHVEWRWLIGTHRADHTNLLLGDLARVGVGLQLGLNLSASLVTMAAYIVAALALSWRLTLMALVAAAIVFLLLGGQRRRALQLGHRQSQASRAVHGNVQETLESIKLSKILGTQDAQLAQFTLVTEQLREKQLQFSENSSLAKALFYWGGAALLTAYVYAGLALWHTATSELMTLVLVFSRLIPQFMSAQQSYGHCLHALPALEQAEKLLAICGAHAEPSARVHGKTWSVQNSIALRGVSVKYEGRKTEALRSLTVDFPARTTTAIIGASGSGKSTLADVLAGLIAPDSGHLLVDDEEVNSPQRLSWRHQVAYVPQEVFLFHDTIRRNLLAGMPSATEAQLRQALEHAAAADFVYRLPDGLDTVVGDGGVLLSGGERQRIALARGLLKRPSLLILDEATSALDTENEARVRQAIEKLHGDMTVIIIGHRLTMLEHVDKVVVLRDGQIHAQGSWAQVRG